MDPKRNSFLLLFVVAILLYLPWLDLKSLSTRGEAREGIVAQSIVTEGEWILPRGYSGVVPSKPPFMHWIVAFLSQINGDISPLTARLPSALFSIAVVILFFLFLRRRIGVDAALLTSLILLSCIEWSRSSVTCRVDMTLSALLFLGMLSLYIWEERGLNSYPVAAPLLFAAATLTKGPVALALPGALWGLYLLLRGRGLQVAIDTGLRVFIPALALSALWYLIAFDQAGQPFFDKVWSENFERFAGTMEDNPHDHSALYLIGTLFLGLLPWSLCFIPTLFRELTQPRTAIKQLKQLISELPHRIRNILPLQLFAWILALGFLVFYSIPSSKRSVYLLPAYPWYALLVAQYLIAAGSTKISLWVTRGLALVLGLLILASLIGLALSRSFPLSLESSRGLRFLWEAFSQTPISVSLILLVLTLAVAITAGVITTNLTSLHPRQLAKLAGVQICGLIFFNGWIAPTATAPLNPQKFVAEIQPFLVGLPVYAYKSQLFGIDLALKQRIYDLTESELKAPALVIANPRDYEELSKKVLPYSLSLLATPVTSVEKAGQLLRVYQIELKAS